MLFEKGSALVPCVNQALAALQRRRHAGRPREAVAVRRGRRTRPAVSRPASAGAEPAAGSSGAGSGAGSTAGRRLRRRRVTTVVVLVAAGSSALTGRRAGRGSGRRSCPGRDAKAAFPAIASALLGQRADVPGRRAADPGARRAGRGRPRRAVAPALFPVRALAVLYTDLFRGVPTSCSCLPGRVRAAGAAAAGRDEQPVLAGRRWPWCCPTAPTSPRCSAPASSRSTPRRSPARRRSASRARSRCATSWCRRRCAASYPRCSTTSSRCRRTPPWSRRSGSSRRLRRRRTTRNYNFNFTPYVVAAAFFVALTIPLARLTDWLGRRYARARAGGGPMSAAAAGRRPPQGVRRQGGARATSAWTSSRTTWSA